MKRLKKPMWRYNQVKTGDAGTTMKGGVVLQVNPLEDGSFEWTVSGCGPGNRIFQKGIEKARERAQQEALRCYRKQVTQE